MVLIMTNDKNNSLCKSQVKNEYLEEEIKSESISYETAKNYARILNFANEYEEKRNKDLCEFSFEEIEEILFDFKSNNRNTIESYGRIISSYLNWCIAKGKSEVNLLGKLKPDDFAKYLTNEETYYTDKQLRRWEEQCANYQDAVIPRLLFIGVGGKQLSEIRNLKKGDIDTVNYKLKLTNTLEADKEGRPVVFSERYIDLDEYTLKLLEGAIAQKIYRKRNGVINQTDSNNIRPHTDLVNNDYVIRPSITKTDNWNRPADRHVVYRRLQTIEEFLGLENFTAKRIQRSGMIYYAKQIVGEEKEVNVNTLKLIALRYNNSSYHNLKGVITMENILKTYPDKK